MRTCEARILKEYPSKKADSMWPESTYGPNDVGTLPICGGRLTITVGVEDTDYGCHSCSGPGRVVIKLVCSRCQWPYIPGRLKFDHDAESVINGLLEQL